jgi:myxalamid-type polyketide synthase MxaB
MGNNSVTDRRLILQKALNALEEMQGKLDAAENSKNEPIAIVGIGCRFPGGSENPESFWKLMQEGGNAVREIPADRWDPEAFYDSDPDAPGKMYIRQGGFLECIDRFDANFFGISPREALSLDPQHRLLLEIAWETLENAGQNPDLLVGSPTGVFVGLTINDYGHLLKFNGPHTIDAYHMTGNHPNFAAGRLSYFLGLQGPSLTVDTACSSSLVTVHLACTSLRSGECGMALAGGVNLILSPFETITACKARMLAPDGLCKTFDARADGFTRGEGCGLLALKRLSDALKNGDKIHAVIRGSAVNQDGAGSGLTVPNVHAQEQVIRKALERAGVNPRQVNYVEAHGTGTALGDPIEIRALSAVFGKDRFPEKPLVIGTVKTNIGHLESAAGIAGLIKVVLAMQHGEIPPLLHLRKLNPYISWEETGVALAGEKIPWNGGTAPRIAGVSSFGGSGTNAHVILEEAPLIAPAEAMPERPLHLLALSAKTEKALGEMAERYHQYLNSHPSAAVADICYTANSGRRHFPYRKVFLARSSGEMSQSLADFVENDSLSMVSAPSPGRKVAFLFTGQGSQYVGMGQALYQGEPVFRQTLERCEDLLRPHLEQPLLSVLYPEGETRDQILNRTIYTQPALFALEYALAEVWRSWGIEPDAVMGHSVGEYVAACVAGVFSLEEGLALIAHRARLMNDLPANGEMAVVFAGEGRVKNYLAHHDDVAIAAVNGPENVVISGGRDSLREILQHLEKERIGFHPLNVSHAFHSPLMKPMLDAFEEMARGVLFKAARIPLVSNVTGRLFPKNDIPGAGYWKDHVRRPVRFADAVTTLDTLHCDTFLELGPGPVLLGMAKQCLNAEAKRWLPSLGRGKDDWEQMLESLGELYQNGKDIDWPGFDRHYRRQRLVLPTYPFQRKRYWAAAKSIVDPMASAACHPLLGRRIDSPFLGGSAFDARISPTKPGYLTDHRIRNAAVVPCAAFVELAVAAATGAGGSGERGDRHNQTGNLSSPVVLKEVFIHDALVLSDIESRQVQFGVMADKDGTSSFQLFSRREKVGSSTDDWKLHVSGKIPNGPYRGSELTTPFPTLSLKQARQRCPQRLSVADHYHASAELGLELGPAFQGLAELWRGQGEALGRIGTVESVAAEAWQYHCHPAILDACFQVFAPLLQARASHSGHGETFLPSAIDHFELFSRLDAPLWSYVRLRPEEQASADVLSADIVLFTESGEVLANIGGLRFMKAAEGALLRMSRGGAPGTRLYKIAWRFHPLQKKESAVAAAHHGCLVVFSDSTGVGESLVSLLKARGIACVQVFKGDAFRAVDDNRYELDPTQPADFRRLFQEALPGDGGNAWGIIYLWGIDADGSFDQGGGSLGEFQSYSCGSVVHILQGLSPQPPEGVSRLWLVTRGCQNLTGEISLHSVVQGPLWGLGSVVANEFPELHCVRVDLDPKIDDKEDGLALLDEIFFGVVGEDQVAYRQKERYLARLTSLESGTASAASTSSPAVMELRIAENGVLDDLSWQPVERRPPKAGEVEIQVHAVGLNFRDVLRALHVLPEETGQVGGECAGVVAAIGEGVERFRVGDAVAAFAPGGFRSMVTVTEDFVVHKPETMTFLEAASIPVVFLTAHYALRHLTKISRGERVLIHAAAGGVGLAAVRIAKRAGAEIFGTAGSPEKRQFLMAEGVHHVMDSRSLDFADEILELTEGRGVHVVLNSLTGDFIAKSLSVLLPGGRFFEIGKRDIWDQSTVRRLRNDVSYQPFDLGTEALKDPGLIKSMFAELMAEFTSGLLQPIALLTFAVDEVTEAFRHMAQARHIGKIVISFPERKPRETNSRQHLMRADGSYLISGGLGALGLQTARWLVEQGAGHLALLGRHGAVGSNAEVLQGLKQQGAHISVFQADLAEAEQVAGVIAEMKRSMPPLRGIIHAAGVLDDGVLLQQNRQRFAKVMAPKIDGAWNLHRETAGEPLDFFIMFSSAAAIIGWPGQGNYAAANAFLDALAHYRLAHGLPALSINWGPWSETGMAAQMEAGKRSRLSARGLQPIDPQDGFLALQSMLNTSHAQVVALSVNWRDFLRQSASGPALPFFAEVAGNMGSAESKPKSSKKDRDFLGVLKRTPAEKRINLLSRYVKREAAAALGLDPEEHLNRQQPLKEMGLDSLMAVELRNTLSALLDRLLPATLLFDYPTIEAIARYLAEEVLGIALPQGEGENTPVEPQILKGPHADMDDLDRLSEAEAEALLIEELACMRGEE